jgi:hypothetical protein
VSELYTTLGQSTLASGYTAGSGSLSLTSAATFPASGTFSVVVDPTGTPLVFTVTGVSGSTLTVVVEHGTDANVASGKSVVEVQTARSFDAIRANISGLGTFANLPTSGMKKGDRYKSTDSPLEFVYDGSAWQAFALGYHVNLPKVADFTWENQSSATAYDTAGGLVMSCPPGNNGGNFAYLVKAISPVSAPYVCDIAFCHRNYIDQSCSVAAVWYESSSGKAKCAILYTDYGTDPRVPMFFAFDKLNSGGAHNSTYYTDHFNGTGPLMWMRLVDDGTNLTVYSSLDGIQWGIVFTAEGRTDFCTPDYVGIGVASGNGNAQDVPMLYCVHFNVYAGAPLSYGYTVS